MALFSDYVTIGEIADVKGGKRLPKGTHIQNEPTAHPYIRVVDLTDYGVDRTNVKYISNSTYERIKQYTISSEDLYISIAGTIGRVGIVPKCLSGANLTENAAKITNINKDFDIQFLLYCLRSPQGQAEIASKIVGTSQPKLALFRIKEIKVPRIPLQTQRKIAAILSAYDDLIENNNRRIRILEEVAQLLYREWFVKFRFPGYERVRMVDSELGPIPEGWEVKKLGDVLELAYGKALKKNERRKGTIPVFGSSGVIGYHDEYLVKGPGIIVGRKGNVGSVFWSNENFYPIDTVFYVITELNLPYCYYALKEQNFINNDSAVPGLSRNQAYLNRIVVPTQEILQKYNDHINPIFSQLYLLDKKNLILRRTRDLLLPKLISGELNVEDLDIAVGGD
ncbi:MAG: restriction endonuclease subunit S [Syntrophothermus sp.]|uniref:restriction endonuclease subunit S n=1 Tax=Syntrophothermus sp. TaxID=2736299 RepID=UPI0025807F83|nr:restriction endonuclease subunit S [Syntrophothermus sp.]NSW83024.1 restriction endonuclease subunit S [Syntrophothermus sp.]